MLFNDYYKILGIKKSASLEEIKLVYRKLSKKFHPDVNNGDEYFQERFKEIQEAYETLSNPEKRKIYDIKYDSFYKTDSSPKPPPPKPPNQPRPQQAAKSNKKSNSQSWVRVVIFILIISLISAIMKGIRDDSAKQKDSLIKIDTADFSHSVTDNTQEIDSMRFNKNKISDSTIDKNVSPVNLENSITNTSTNNNAFHPIANFEHRTFYNSITHYPVKLRMDTIHNYYVDAVTLQKAHYFFYDPMTRDTFDYLGRKVNNVNGLNNSFRITTFKSNSDEDLGQSGCGCYFSRSKKEYEDKEGKLILVGGLIGSEGDYLRININGKRVKLFQIHTIEENSNIINTEYGNEKYKATIYLKKSEVRSNSEDGLIWYGSLEIIDKETNLKIKMTLFGDCLADC